MNRKLLLITVLAVFMLMAISYATAVNTKTSEIVTKESPLYNIRTRRAIDEKIGDIIDNIKTRFLGERAFFIPFYRLSYLDDSEGSREEFAKCLGGYTDVKFCSFKNSPLMTCIYSVGNCCPTGAK